jgi:inner membrane protein
MDSVTQIALGAAVGEAVAGRKAGNKAVLWGAIAGTIPDLDVIPGYFMETVDALEFHRGMTHSILFAVLLSPLLAYGIKQLYRNNETSWRDWTLLVFLGLFTHSLLDCFTTWGTQLFWPFSDYRVAFKSIFVIDPLYTLPLLICLVWLMFVPKNSKKRRNLNYTGLALSTFYLLATVVIKHQANQVFESSFVQQQIPVERYDSKPSPLNTILWAVTAETEEGYYIGYYSFLDDDEVIDYFFFEKNHHLLERFTDSEKVQQLLKITDGWYTVEAAEEGVIVNDLRFGQSTGWETGTGKFVFSYRIVKQNGKVSVEEVEKDFQEGREMLKPLWDRIRGISASG